LKDNLRLEEEAKLREVKEKEEQERKRKLLEFRKKLQNQAPLQSTPHPKEATPPSQKEIKGPEEEPTTLQP